MSSLACGIWVGQVIVDLAGRLPQWDCRGPGIHDVMLGLVLRKQLLSQTSVQGEIVYNDVIG